MKPFLSFDRQFSGVTFSIFLAQGFTFSATTQPNYLPWKKGGTKNIREIKCLLPFGDPNTQKKSISKSDDVSLYGQQRRRMCVPKSVAISHVSLPPGSQNIFPQIFKKPANLLGTGNCDGVEYLIELPHWNILSALPNPAAAHNSNLALGYHLIKSKSVYEPYFSRPSSLFFFFIVPVAGNKLIFPSFAGVFVVSSFCLLWENLNKQN